MTVDEIMAAIALLPEHVITAALDSCDARTARDRVFVDAYSESLNVRKAAALIGQKPYWGNKRLEDMEICERIDAKLQQRAAASDLNAEYVRQYIMDVLELCPTDYFVDGPKGEWMIDPENFKDLPREVKRLVESVEQKFVAGQRMVVVKFISKTAVLSMAAKFSLVEKHSVDVNIVPWDQLLAAAQKEACDPIEARLEALNYVVR